MTMSERQGLVVLVALRQRQLPDRVGSPGSGIVGGLSYQGWLKFFSGESSAFDANGGDA
jgi:hypothetical protein